eukprot:gene46424-59693_t
MHCPNMGNGANIVAENFVFSEITMLAKLLLHLFEEEHGSTISMMKAPLTVSLKSEPE